MPSLKEFVSQGLLCAAAMAIIFRVEFVREIVTGIQTEPVSKTDPKAKRMLYV